jgi:hypothetical protein
MNSGREEEEGDRKRPLTKKGRWVDLWLGGGVGGKGHANGSKCCVIVTCNGFRVSVVLEGSVQGERRWITGPFKSELMLKNQKLLYGQFPIQIRRQQSQRRDEKGAARNGTRDLRLYPK